MNSAIATVWLPLLVLGPIVGVWIFSLVDFSRTDERDMRLFSPEVWVLVLVLGSVAGGLLWLMGGRPQRPARHHRP